MGESRLSIPELGSPVSIAILAPSGGTVEDLALVSDRCVRCAFFVFFQLIVCKFRNFAHFGDLRIFEAPASHQAGKSTLHHREMD